MRIVRVMIALALVLLLPACDREPEAWQAARTAHTIQAYEQYLAEHPGGAHAGDAQVALMPLKAGADWEQARNTNKAEAFGSFAAAYPDSNRAAEARVLARALRMGKVDVATAMRTPPNSFMQSSPSGRLVDMPNGTRLTITLTSTLDGEPVTAELEGEYTRIDGDLAMFETEDGQCLGVALGPYGSGGTAEPCDGSEQQLPDPDDPAAVLVYAWKFVEAHED